MAIIADKAPNTPPVQNAKRRIVVKLFEGAQVQGDAEESAQPGARAAKAVSALSPGLALAPYLPSVRSVLRTTKGEPQKLRARTPSPVLKRYFVMEVPGDQDAEALAKRTRALPDVETAYVEGGPTPPPIMPADDPRSLNQGYLDAAPNGIDARFAWDFADGTGVTFADLERGWTLAHEDLVAAGITLISGKSQDFHGHGTAVLGEVVGVDNTRGGIGIAPGAHARVVSQWRDDGSYNTADAIISASLALDAGDVLLLEAQTSHPNASGYVPVEVEDAVFDAIADAVAAGIIVVEAGANGSVDLDAFTNSAGKQILNRASKDFRDSGAILVGAATSGTRAQLVLQLRQSHRLLRVGRRNRHLRRRLDRHEHDGLHL